MSAYVDASVAVSMFAEDIHTPRVLQWVHRQAGPLILSAWAVTEFSSALALQRRRGALDSQDRLAAEAAFDGWLSADQIRQVEIGDADFVAARQLMRFDTTSLRAGNALHLAVTMRLGATMATLDAELAAAAKMVGLRLDPL